MSDKIETARAELRERLAARDQAVAVNQQLADEENKAVRIASDARAELEQLEAEADKVARAAINEGSTPADAFDLEAKIAACRRRIATAEAMATEASKRRPGNDGARPAAEAATWAARDVLAAEGMDLLAEYERVQRQTLELEHRLDMLTMHLRQVRGSAENQTYPAFGFPERLRDAMVKAQHVDEIERWNIGKDREAWAAFEQALLADPGATLPA